MLSYNLIKYEFNISVVSIEDHIVFYRLVVKRYVNNPKMLFDWFNQLDDTKMEPIGLIHRTFPSLNYHGREVPALDEYGFWYINSWVSVIYKSVDKSNNIRYSSWYIENVFIPPNPLL